MKHARHTNSESNDSSMRRFAHEENTEQARMLRFRLLGRMGAMLLAWTAVFALLCVFFELFISDDLGNYVANKTSTWVYSTYGNLSESSDGAMTDDSAASDASTSLEGGSLETQSLTDAEKDEQYKIALENGYNPEEPLQRLYDKLGYPNGSENIQVALISNGVYAARDLSTYKAIRSLKLPVAIVVYAIGVIVVIIRTLNRSLSYFSKLSNALSDPRLIEGGQVELPKELTITSQQLELLQTKVRDHEQAAVMAEQRKNEMVAYLAHDIRTPLTSVLGYLSLLAESPDLPIEKRAEYAGIALAKAERLETLVEEFFEITRYNLDSIVLERENVDVSLFLDQVVDEFGITAQERGITLKTIALNGEHAFLDPSKMARALGNVMKNAITYADAHSEVVLSAVVTDTELVLTCSNQGREISKTHLDAIFERFYREDTSRGQSANAGLGLAITREIVETHGGTIVAESTNGRTTFTMRLPR